MFSGGTIGAINPGGEDIRCGSSPYGPGSVSGKILMSDGFNCAESPWHMDCKRVRRERV